ncbi:hypothetical protein [Blautia wexlerae]|uniref:hypothetical protein n=1 Tax=Blautia wexlerae TaxID=418240 RepID=UPI0034A3F36A
MEICNLERGKGKTTYLVHRSHVTQYPIVCADYKGVGVAKDIAERIGISIPEPMTVQELLKDRSLVGHKKFLIDEAPMVLQGLLKVDIDTITLSERDR